uniref:NTR domain-containing protein n=1 Tax=Macrostomum lignano TaxID=282301 RepID=A0A1I8JQS9_9PLAT
HNPPTSSADYAALIQQAPQLQPYYLTTTGSQPANRCTCNVLQQLVHMAQVQPSEHGDDCHQSLDPAKKYEVYVTLMLGDRHTLKYQREACGCPMVEGEDVPRHLGCTGGGFFMRLKLTNKLDCFASEPARNGTMIFSRTACTSTCLWCTSRAATAFYTAVTFPLARSSSRSPPTRTPELTDLKIQFNPYAKGIRNQGDRSGAAAELTVSGPPCRLCSSNCSCPAVSRVKTSASPTSVEFGSYPRADRLSLRLLEPGSSSRAIEAGVCTGPIPGVEASPTVLAASSTISSTEVDSSSSAACALHAKSLPSQLPASLSASSSAVLLSTSLQLSSGRRRTSGEMHSTTRRAIQMNSNCRRTFIITCKVQAATVPLPLLSTPQQRQQQQQLQQLQHSVKQPQQQSARQIRPVCRL